eukprot:m.172050 g.172050  ORF g.172050 m.172050 type:complete len:536 (-) comp16714_c0_seq1:56-1663(-)
MSVEDAVTPSQTAFSLLGDEVLEREVADAGATLDSTTLQHVFELDRCVTAITDHGFKRVGLQFPDALLPNASAVYHYLTDNTDASLFIMGDTSYGSCCVDEVAAEHANADLIIHFGHSCLSRTTRLPTLFVFGQLPLDVEDCIRQATAKIAVDRSIVLVSAVEYAYALDQVALQLQASHTQVVVGRLDPAFSSASPLAPLSPESLAETEPEVADTHACGCASSQACCNEDQSGVQTVPSQTADVNTLEQPQQQHRFGRVDLPEPSKLAEDACILFIGEANSRFLTSFTMQYNQTEVVCYNPVKSTCQTQDLRTNKRLMRRYFLTQKVKEAQSVGILIGTLGVANYMHVIAQIKQLCKAAEKQYFVFLMGKLNPAKLANFSEVDVYCLIACHENSMLDSSEFFKPLVTPYELELACGPDREWTGRYEFDFQTLIADMREDLLKMDQTGPSNEPHFSLISQSYVSRDSDRDGDTSTALSLRQGGAMVATGQARSLAERSYQGLDPRLGETPVEQAIEGRTGIAIGYDKEPEPASSSQ